MKIVIDYNSLFKNNFSLAYCRYLVNATLYLETEKSQVEFVGVGDKTSSKKIALFRSSTNMIVRKSWPGIAGWKIWYYRQLPSILKKTKADLLITTGIASTNIQIPQCIWIPEISKEYYLKKDYFAFITAKLPQTLAAAKIIFTNSERNKKILGEFQESMHSKLIVIPEVADENANPILWHEREEIKKSLTTGREYFLVHRPAISGSVFVNLLKSFSQFKKRQQSNMQLVITGVEREKEYLQNLEGFKYKSDVHLFGAGKKMNYEKIMAAAYALLQPAPDESEMLNSFRRKVPVITSKPAYPEGIDPNAVLFGNFSMIEDLAAQLMILYKDEKLRNNLVEKGTEISARLTRKSQADLLWNGIMSAVDHRR